jgi:hypothetical protein
MASHLAHGEQLCSPVRWRDGHSHHLPLHHAIAERVSIPTLRTAWLHTTEHPRLTLTGSRRMVPVIEECLPCHSNPSAC